MHADDTSILNMGSNPEELKNSYTWQEKASNTVLWIILHINISFSKQSKVDMTLI